MSFNELYALGLIYIDSRSGYLFNLGFALFLCVPIVIARLYYMNRVKQIAPKASVEEMGLSEVLMMLVLILMFPLVGGLSVLWLVMRQTYIEAKYEKNNNWL